MADEHAQFTDRENFNAMSSGQLNVVNPLTFITTTAYAVDNSVMLSDLDTCRKVLEGQMDDPNRFSLIYYAEKEHAWDDIGMYQANPLRIEENYDEIRKKRNLAQNQEDLETEFLTKHCNIFQPANAGDTYIVRDDLELCKMGEEDKGFTWKGKKVYVGLDMALRNDNCAVVMLCEWEGRIYARAVGFFPIDNLAMKTRKEKVDYQMLMRKGYMIGCGDRTISDNTIRDYILDIPETFGCTIEGVYYDPMNGTGIKEDLKAYGLNVTDIPQYAKYTHEPTTMLRDYILSRKFRYESNPMYENNFCNARTFPTDDLKIYINKKKSAGKVDMAVATIFALRGWIDDRTQPKLYKSHGIRFV